VAFEQLLFSYRHNFGLEYAALRYANVYGPRQDHLGEGGVVAIFASRIVAGQPCTIYGDGSKVRDLVYVGDVAQANVAALDRGSGLFNIGAGRDTDIGELFRELSGLAPDYRLAPCYEPDKPGEVWESRLDVRQAAAALGWRAAASLREGLARTLAYHVEARRLLDREPD
jgi:UDP-glucose 4-epimerase